MKPKLILLNGNPGMGKSTLAERYASEHPLTLNLDVDRIWHMMGQWQSSLDETHRLKRKHSYALAESHLAEGYNVIVADLMESVTTPEKFERIAKIHGALFREVALVAEPADAIERCKARARSMGYEDGFRPGGVLDLNGREQKLIEMYQNMQEVTRLRPNTVQIEPLLGDIEGTTSSYWKQ